MMMPLLLPDPPALLSVIPWPVAALVVVVVVLVATLGTMSGLVPPSSPCSMILMKLERGQCAVRGKWHHVFRRKPK